MNELDKNKLREETLEQVLKKHNVWSFDLELDLFRHIEEWQKKVLQECLDKQREMVMPFLKELQSTYSSDWSLYPVQAQHAIYISPEQGLRNAADAIDRKRTREIELNKLIFELSPKPSKE